MSSSNRPAIAAEIQAALTQHGTLTSSELTDCCPSADDREVVSKVIYQLRLNGIIEKAGTVPGAPGRGAKEVSQWRLATAVAPESTHPKEKPMPSVHWKFPVSPSGDPLPPAYEAINAAEPSPANPFGTTDPTEEALSDLVDQADEAVLAMADSLLSDHPVWSRLRALQNDAFQALCDWRLRSYLASQEMQK